jgi:hypothetical protein
VAQQYKWVNPMCSTCAYVLPSETSKTKLRCGLTYFQSTPLARKFQLMQHFPEVKDFNACESWLDRASEAMANSLADLQLALKN